MKAEMIFTGKELLVGQNQSAQGRFLGRKLSDLGTEVILHTTVGDNRQLIKSVFKEALGRSDIIIITTSFPNSEGNVINETVAEVMGLPLVLHEESLVTIKDYYGALNVVVPDDILKKIYFPQGAMVLSNPCGVVPGALLETESEQIILILTNRSWELEAIYDQYLADYFSSMKKRGEITRFFTFKLMAIREDNIQEILAGLDGVENPEIAYIARQGEIHVRISAHAKTGEKADALIYPLARQVKRRLEPYIFAENEEKIQEVVARMLKDRVMTIGIAETYTAGLLQATLCSMSGCSKFVKGGFICYNRQSVLDILHIDSEKLSQEGLVSEWTANSMAEKARHLLQSDIGLAVTGVAGPDSLENKDVGIVYIALSTPEGALCTRYKMPGGRTAIRVGSVNASLNMVRQYLKGECTYTHEST